MEELICENHDCKNYYQIASHGQSGKTGDNCNFCKKPMRTRQTLNTENMFREMIIEFPHLK